MNRGLLRQRGWKILIRVNPRNPRFNLIPKIRRASRPGSYNCANDASKTSSRKSASAAVMHIGGAKRMV